MNKLKKYFWEKTKTKLLLEIYKYGLEVKDDVLFDRRVFRVMVSNIIYSGLLIVLLIWLVISWFL